MIERNLAILLFDDAEVLDFCGPFEVFSVASNQTEVPSFNICTVAERTPITARNGLSVNPIYTLDSCPKADILLVPGGIGSRQQINNEILIDWIRRTADDAELVLSVCTGALLLGKAGLLNDLAVTTHHVAFDVLRELVPSATVHEDRRFVDNGKVITLSSDCWGRILHGPQHSTAQHSTWNTRGHNHDSCRPYQQLDSRNH